MGSSEWELARNDHHLRATHYRLDCVEPFVRRQKNQLAAFSTRKFRDLSEKLPALIRQKQLKSENRLP